MTKADKIFNIVASGVGGQGLITLSWIIAEAAFLEGKDVRMSELHGLSQRAGSVAVQLRLGENIYSPLISQGEADLVLSLEKNEALKSCYFSFKKRTIFLINDFEIYSASFKNQKLPSLRELRKFSKKTYLLKATEIVEKKLGLSVVAGVYLLSYAAFLGLLPLKPESILKAIKKVVPRGFNLNKKAFELAKKET